MTYVNSIGGQSHTAAGAQQGAEEQNRPRPEVDVGDLVVLKVGDGDTWGLPFWMASVTKKAAAEVATIKIKWVGPFKGTDGKGYHCDNVNTTWRCFCKGSDIGRDGKPRYHAYTTKCMHHGRDRAGHGEIIDEVNRDEILLYFATLNSKKRHMCSQLDSNLDTSPHLDAQTLTVLCCRSLTVKPRRSMSCGNCARI